MYNYNTEYEMIETLNSNCNWYEKVHNKPKHESAYDDKWFTRLYSHYLYFGTKLVSMKKEFHILDFNWSHFIIKSI